MKTIVSTQAIALDGDRFADTSTVAVKPTTTCTAIRTSVTVSISCTGGPQRVFGDDAMTVFMHMSVVPGPGPVFLGR